MNAILRFVFLSLIVVCVASCDQKWTQEEKENADHFLKSLDLVIEAHSTSNKGVPGVMPRQDFEKILSLYQRALSESNLVRDDVLDMAHPELKSNYRMYFQKGIELRISAWMNRKTYDEIQGSALMDSWGDWFEKNRQNIRIPR
ncbi:MAG TPA: hypothetical protein VGB26_10890 [Nitrospiria bacterium]|jgi:hypothetical protein